MIFSKALILKVLGGMAVCTGVTIGGVKLLGGSKTKDKNGDQTQQDKSPDERPSEGTQGGGQNPNPGSAGNLENTNSDSDPQGSRTDTQQPEETPEELIKKAGLSCGDVNSVSDTGNECSILTDPTDSKINVKQGQTTFEVSSIPDNSGKIKLHKLSGYNKNLKFVIEDGNITKDSHTLEQYETYEITEEGEGEEKKYYLTRKTTSFEEKMKLLGIPSTKCNVVEGSVDKSCDLTGDETKALNFDGKNQDPAVSGNTTLKIVKSSEDGFAEEGYKFIINTTDSITVTKSDSSSYTLKAGTKTEFKIKKAEANKWTLEKAWDASELGKKVGLENCTTDGCTFKTNETINVMNKNNVNIEGTISEANKKIQFVKDQKDYNQGIKFYSSADITLGDGNKKIVGNGSSGSYDIREIDKKWYLFQVTSN